MDELKEHIKNVSRVSRADRVETSINIANKYFKNPEYSFAANGWQNTDALVSGYFAAMKNGPIVLINDNIWNNQTMNYLSEYMLNHMS